MTFDTSWTLGLEAHTRCKKCHFILPLNGPVSFVSCAKCGERHELSREVWDDVLAMPAKMSRVMRDGTTKSCQVGIGADALVMKATREAPRCRSCQRELDPRTASETCGGCGKSLSSTDAPALLGNTHRSLQRTFLAASEGSTSEAAERWYLWFYVDPAGVEADRKLAEIAVKRIEAKLPKLEPFPLPRSKAPVVEHEAPVMMGSAYRGQPSREIASDDVEKPDDTAPTMSRNLALFLIALALAVGFLVGRTM